jgi:hypothetical protein
MGQILLQSTRGRVQRQPQAAAAARRKIRGLNYACSQYLAAEGAFSFVAATLRLMIASAAAAAASASAAARVCVEAWGRRMLTTASFYIPDISNVTFIGKLLRLCVLQTKYGSHSNRIQDLRHPEDPKNVLQLHLHLHLHLHHPGQW